MPPDRSRGDPFWIYTSTIDLSDIILLDRETLLYKYVGLIDGYPICIVIDKIMTEEQNSLGAHPSIMTHGFGTMD